MKACIYILLLTFLISGIYNGITNFIGDYCISSDKVKSTILLTDLTDSENICFNEF